jgi:isopentenyl diphosphate isomerase/L-lactate dehydrogenase-like FMN-dependent dehydrogenase
VSDPISVEDFRRRAAKRLARVAFDFIDGGAEDELSVRENRRAFQDLALRPAVLAGVGECPRLEVEVAGEQLSVPVIIAPTGGAQVAGPTGELAAATAAEALGTAAIISHGTSVPYDDLAAAVNRPPWFQVLFLRDRGWMEELLAHLAERGAPVLVATADTPISGSRERDHHHGLTYPVRPRLRWAPQLVRRPRWAFNTLRHSTVLTGLPEISRPNLSQSFEELVDPSQTWADLEWIRERWKGPLLLKGVMRGDDAAHALDLGCQGVVVSNHGGRQLDAVAGSVAVLPEVVEAVAGRGTVLLDGGVRRGTDVIKALALGADACLVGRPWLWGLAAGGTAGVEGVLETFRDELTRALILLGVADVADLDPSVLLRRQGCSDTGWTSIQTEG